MSDATKPITGLVRSDWVVDEPQSVLPLAHRNHRPYPVADIHDAANVLTERGGREAPRKALARRAWKFTDALGQANAEQSALTHVRLEGGFKPGKIYELVYRARDPLVIGLGLAAIRDIASYAKYRKDALFPAQQAIAFGVSQTGRFLRHFLYQDFNTDEQGRPVYDAMFIHSRRRRARQLQSSLRAAFARCASLQHVFLSHRSVSLRRRATTRYAN